MVGWKLCGNLATVFVVLIFCKDIKRLGDSIVHEVGMGVDQQWQKDGDDMQWFWGFGPKIMFVVEGSAHTVAAAEELCVDC